MSSESFSPPAEPAAEIRPSVPVSVPATASQGLHVLAWRVATSAIGFIATIMIARGLGPEGRGAYSLYTAAALTLITVSKLGLEQANVYFRASRGVAADQLLVISSVVAFSVGTVAIGVMASLPNMVPAVFADAPRFLLIVAGLVIPFSVHQMLVAGLQTLDNRVTHQFKAGAIAAVWQVTLLTALSLFTGLSVLAVLFVNATTVVTTWMLTLGRADAPRVIGRVDWTLLRHSLRHAIVLHVGMCFFFLHLRVDLFMLGALTDKGSVGQYSVAVMLAETVQLVTDSLAIALVPRQVGNTVPEAALVALRGARINLLVGLVLAAGWVLVGYPLIVVLLGREFAPAYMPLVALLPGILFMGMQRVCGPALLRTGRPGWMTAIFGASLAMNVGLNAWFIPWYGATGAGLASTISYAFGAALFLWWTSRLANVSLARAVPTGREAIEIATMAWTMTRQFVKRGTSL